MKKTFLLLILSLVFQLSYGQRADWKTAEKHFYQFEYVAAADAYEKIVQQDPANVKAIERLALCYNKLNNPAKAERWLAKACNLPNAAPEFYRMYAQALASNEKYSESAQWYSKYNGVAADESTKRLSTLDNTIDKFYTDSAFYQISPLPVNSTAADFSPAFYKDGIVFCSARKNKSNVKFGWNNSHFIDLYQVQQQGHEAINFGAPVNASLHEGPAAFSKNYDTLYFTRNDHVNNRKSASAENIVKLKIFFSVYKDGVWSKAQGISINHNDYSIGHPTLSGNHGLYFVSDMPGGYGGTDLYFTKWQHSKWATPVNLGSAINTSGNEMFPFIGYDGNLYFSSTGHPGLGGLDIFCAKSINGKYTQPQNIGYPVNSSRDDFGFIIKEDKGFFSSNRGEDPQDDNLYSFTVDYTRSINIQVIDDAGAPLENFSVAIASDTSALQEKVEKMYTGRFNALKDYSIQCSKNGYTTKQLTLTTVQLKLFPNNYTVKVKLDRAIKNIRIDLQSVTGSKLAGGTIEIKNISTGEIKKVNVDANGSISAAFQAGQQYQLAGAHPKYKSKTFDLDRFENLDADAVIPIVLQSPEALFEKNEIGQIIELDIRYDVNKSVIRKDAALELNKLIVFLKKNPAVKVELGSHTDARGSNEANHVLSQKRAEAAVRYIVAKGISSKRLIPIGYGEDDLKVKDATSEPDHQLNRRTTIKIVGI